MDNAPCVSLLEPSRLHGYDRRKPHDQQPSHIPSIFCDAMEVRETVFVKEQGVPLELEQDDDDVRSCHWVAYMRVHQALQHRPETEEVLTPDKSITNIMPIGTLRIVPFPHPPHPKDGGWYVGGELRDRPGHAAEVDGNTPTVEVPTKAVGEAPTPPRGRDRPTTLHDGEEPYVKLGRLAVVTEYRGRGVARSLWRAASSWLEAHPAYFNSGVMPQPGSDEVEVGAGEEGDAPAPGPVWRGLVCCHAQEQVVKTYQRWGFQVDEGMGRWHEEGMPHLGMFARLDVHPTPP